MVSPSFFADKAGKKFKVTFDYPVRFRGMRKASEAIIIRIFKGSAGQVGFMTGASKSKGQSIYDLNSYNHSMLTAVEVIEPTNKKEEPTPEQNLAKVKSKLHPNAWPSLRNQTNTDEDFLHGLKFCNPVKKFNKFFQAHLTAQVQAAFDNGTEFSYQQLTSHHMGRDLSIRISPNADGTVNARFDSEHMGCGNGDYWLMLNPTLAVFYEAD